MSPEERQEASKLVHKWARHFDGQGTFPSEPTLQSLRVMSRYARWLEEQNGRLEIELGADVTVAGQSIFGHARDGWWVRLLKSIGLR